jgi:excisionase family DNA binding protein
MAWRSFQPQPIAATEAEQWAAREAWRALGPETEGVALVLVRDGKTATVPLPPAAVRLLQRALDDLGDGHEVAVVPVQREVTTQEAAKIMRVSRPFVVKMLDRGCLRGRKVGKHRRVLLRDALAFRAGW